MGTADLRRLPSVERLASWLERDADAGAFPRPLIIACAREVVDAARARLLHNEPVELSPDALVGALRAALRRYDRPTLTGAVNATGIIVHTNLGRAPLSVPARRAVEEAAGYATLEIEPSTGRRGSRHQHVEPLLVQLTGAEAGIAVNNNAAAVLLSLAAVARGKEVIVSRGELVEIGGSFRLPEVMAQSGATLVETGTTNRTYLHDYERAITAQTGLLLKVHRSNFVMGGFVQETGAPDLVDLGRRRGIPVMFDLGSGCLVDLRSRGLPYEPTVPDAVRAGCDIVTFSGDKLLGGPQAGVVVGGSGYLDVIRAHPLARAVRLDKLGSAALAATLRHYLDPARAWREVPVLQMLAVPADEVRRRAERFAATVQATLPPAWTVEVRASVAEVGGGAVPEAHLPSFAVAITGPGSAMSLHEALRSHQPAVFGRIEDDAYLLDFRTVLPAEEVVVTEALRQATSGV